MKVSVSWIMGQEFALQQAIKKLDRQEIVYKTGIAMNHAILATFCDF